MTDPAAILESLLGADAVVPWEQLADTLAPALTGALAGARDSRPAVVYPNSEAQLAAVMACAHQHQWRVLPCGSGSKLAWGGLTTAIDVVVSTARLNQVIDHAIGDMTLTAQAGVTLAELAPRLAQAHQFLALDPAYPDQATLGGIIATADAGSLRQRYGGGRDMLIGVTLVRYDGQLAKAGGRVVKNVAGYDLMKLMTGSYGTLGIMSQLTFRLYPVQDVSTTVVVSGPAATLRSFTAALRLSSLTPVTLDLLSPALAERLGCPADLALAARFQSIAPGVEEQVEQLLSQVPPPLTASRLSSEADLDFWHQANRALFPPAGTPPAGTPPAGSENRDSLTRRQTAIAKIGLRPTEAVTFLEKLSTLPGPSLARIHASSGLGTVQLVDEGVTVEGVQELRSRCEQFGGYLTLLEAPAALKQCLDVWGYNGNALLLMQAIKAQFDPHQILSPGRFVGGL